MATTVLLLLLDPTKKSKECERLSPSAGENDVVLGVYSTIANSLSLVGLPKDNGAVEEEKDKTQLRFTAKSDMENNG